MPWKLVLVDYLLVPHQPPKRGTLSAWWLQDRESITLSGVMFDGQWLHWNTGWEAISLQFCVHSPTCPDRGWQALAFCSLHHIPFSSQEGQEENSKEPKSILDYINTFRLSVFQVVLVCHLPWQDTSLEDDTNYLEALIWLPPVPEKALCVCLTLCSFMTGL